MELNTDEFILLKHILNTYKTKNDKEEAVASILSKRFYDQTLHY